MTKQREKSVIGRVIEALPNTNFKVEFKDGEIAMCYLSGKMRKNKIYVVVGDKVEAVLDAYGDRGRIIFRR